MLKSLTALWLGLFLFHFVNSYYTSRRCYGTGDCHLLTKNQDGGFDDAKHQWLVECGDGEGAVAIRDDDSHFEGLSGLWCAFLFPLKQSSRGAYPYFPSCVVRNLTAAEYHCSGSESSPGNHSTELFVSGIYKEPDEKQVFVPSLMKCCEMPTDYKIDYSRCYYKKTFDRFGEHYTGEWLVKCDTHHLVTGMGKDVNPWDNKEHFTWIQCCPFYYTANQQQKTYSNLAKAIDKASYLFTSGSTFQPLLNDPGQFPQQQQPALTGTGRADFFPETSSPTGEFYQPARLATSGGPTQFHPSATYKPSTNYFATPSINNYPNSNHPSPNPFSQASNIPIGPQYQPSSSYPNNGYANYLYYNSPSNQTSPILEGPPMNAIQHYANVAAYQQFISTFNDLLNNYTKQQAAAPKVPNGEGFAGPAIGGYTPLVYQRPASDVPLQTAMENVAAGYVQPPLPSGLQNYVALTSPNPGQTLSSLYSGQLPSEHYSPEYAQPTGFGGTVDGSPYPLGGTADGSPYPPGGTADGSPYPPGGSGYGTGSSGHPQYGFASGHQGYLYGGGGQTQGSYGYGHGGGNAPVNPGGFGGNGGFVKQLYEQNQHLQYLLSNMKSQSKPVVPGPEPAISSVTVANSGGTLEIKTNGSQVLVNVPGNITAV
ncbi:hypothetical protein BV898_12399 [Hypsibius exemplaris]|uniref:Uncharacterized protein n=1 Tax=Hypsibius exemplaris TaxID=2072580 RepID=A0A1W0WDT6_HYPEX|nr:hypothetical protein BV898_12399 [Hypsibius exemplaris]